MSTNLLDLKTIRMVYFIIFVLLIWIWIITEFINAPYQSNTNKNDSTTQSNDSNPEAE
jgi:ATP/ADP translocase